MHSLNEKILKKRVGNLIVKQRKALKISQEVLAEKLDIHVRTLGKIENGHSFVTADVLCKLSEIFNIPPKAFLDVVEKDDFDNDKLNIIIEKLCSGGNEKIDLYYNIINLIDSTYKN